MCLVTPQQNNTDSPLCHTGGSPLWGHCVWLATLRLSPSPHRGGFKDIALFQFTETFLHSLPYMNLSRVSRLWHERLFAPRIEILVELKEIDQKVHIVGYGKESIEYATLYSKCIAGKGFCDIRQASCFVPWRFLSDILIRKNPNAIYIVALPRPWKFIVRNACDAMSPIFVGHKIDLRGGWESILKNMESKKKRKYVRSYLREEHRNVVFSSELVDFNRFYDEIYVPFVETRHGALVRIMSKEQALKSFKAGGLLKLFHEGKWVAGAIVHEEADHHEGVLIAVCTSTEGKDLVKDAQQIIYIECISRAISKGMSWYILGGTKPFPAQGLYAAKNSFGSKVTSMGPYIGNVALFLPVNPLTRDSMLNSSPILTIDPNGNLIKAAKGKE